MSFEESIQKMRGNQSNLARVYNRSWVFFIDNFSNLSFLLFTYTIQNIKFNLAWFVNSLFSSFDGGPSFLAEWTGVFLLAGPSADTVGVVGVIAWAPRDHTWVALSFVDLIGLALEAAFVNAVFADGTIFNCDVPAPESNCVPLFDFNSFVDFHFESIGFKNYKLFSQSDWILF